MLYTFLSTASNAVFKAYIQGSAYSPLMPTVAIIMGTAIKHLAVPDQVKPSFVIFDIRAF